MDLIKNLQSGTLQKYWNENCLKLARFQSAAKQVRVLFLAVFVANSTQFVAIQLWKLYIWKSRLGVLDLVSSQPFSVDSVDSWSKSYIITNYLLS